MAVSAIIFLVLTMPDGGSAEEERSIGRFRKALSIVVVNVHPEVDGTIPLKSGSADDCANIARTFLPANINTIALEADPCNLGDLL